jgi:hypothetical protein
MQAGQARRTTTTNNNRQRLFRFHLYQRLRPPLPENNTASYHPQFTHFAFRIETRQHSPQYPSIDLLIHQPIRFCLDFTAWQGKAVLLRSADRVRAQIVALSHRLSFFELLAAALAGRRRRAESACCYNSRGNSCILCGLSLLVGLLLSSSQQKTTTHPCDTARFLPICLSDQSDRPRIDLLTRLSQGSP